MPSICPSPSLSLLCAHDERRFRIPFHLSFFRVFHRHFKLCRFYWITFTFYTYSGPGPISFKSFSMLISHQWYWSGDLHPLRP